MTGAENYTKAVRVEGEMGWWLGLTRWLCTHSRHSGCKSIGLGDRWV